MKQITILALLVISVFGQAHAQGYKSSIKETMLTKDRGFFTCSGEASAILFKQDCLEMNLDRVSFGGEIVYEGTCLEASGKKIRLSCSNYVFEPEVLDANSRKTYFDK